MKQPAEASEKIFAIHITDKGLKPITSKELLQSKRKR